MSTDTLISLLHPTRERMELCLATTRTWSASVEGSGIEVEHLVAIDAQDADAYADYLRLGKEEAWFAGDHRAVVMDGARLELGADGSVTNVPAEGEDTSGVLTAVTKVNRLAALAKGRWLFFIADDFQPTWNDWLPAMKETLDRWDPRWNRIVLSPESDGRALVNHPILSRAFYQWQGSFFCPEYLHVCVDCDLHEVATREKALHHLPRAVCEKFKHANPYLTTEGRWDRVYSIANNAAIYEQGSRVLARRKELLAQVYAPQRRGLNVGCGSRPRTSDLNLSWTNMDQTAHPGVDVVRDIRRGFPFADDIFDEVLLDNVLEHFVSDDMIFLLNEIHRVAKPGAAVTIIVPHALSQGAVQDPTHKSLFVPRSALYWNQFDTPYGGVRLGITANLRHKEILVTGDMTTEAFITYRLVAEK